MGTSGTSWINKIPLQKFAEVVAMEMLENKLSNDHEDGKPMSQAPLRASAASNNPTECAPSSASVGTARMCQPSVDKDGFVENFARMKIGEKKKDKVGEYFNGFLCTHNPNGHIIVQQRNYQKCHVCTVRFNSKENKRSRHFCLTCGKSVCLDRKNFSCMSIHSLINPMENKASNRSRGQELVKKAIAEFEMRKRQENASKNETEKLASTV